MRIEHLEPIPVLAVDEVSLDIISHLGGGPGKMRLAG